MSGSPGEADGDGEFVFSASLSHVRGLRDVLLAVKQTKKQVATLLVDAHGLKVFTHDDSRVLQGCAFLRREARERAGA